jgi:hypothetical protein
VLPSVLKFGLHVPRVVLADKVNYPQLAGKGKQLSVASCQLSVGRNDLIRSYSLVICIRARLQQLAEKHATADPLAAEAASG